MSIRKTPFVNGEFYHIYNRGIDKRTIFEKESDLKRFLEILIKLNTKNVLGGLYRISTLEKNVSKEIIYGEKLVDIVAFCLNPNHFHLIIKQNEDGGISKFMQRVGTGYTMYFNDRNERSGSLFQGKFKSKHVDNNEYLLYLSAYVNLNNKIHGIDNAQNITFSSIGEYTEDVEGFCNKSIILDQYKNKDEYKKFLDESLPELIRQKEQQKELEE